MSGLFNFTIEQGAFFSKRFKWIHPNKEPIDLSLFYVRMHIRESKDSTTKIATLSEGNGRILNEYGGDSGALHIWMSASETKELDFTSAFYDIEAVRCSETAFTQTGDYNYLVIDVSDTNFTHDEGTLLTTDCANRTDLGGEHLGGDTAWSSVDNAKLDDAATADIALTATGQQSQFLHLKDFDFNIPADRHIVGIKVKVERHRDAGTTDIKDLVVALTIGKNNIVGDNMADISTNWPTSATEKVYGGTAEPWGYNWTPDLINTEGFGVAIQTHCSDTDGDGKIDYVKIQVYTGRGTITARKTGGDPSGTTPFSNIRKGGIIRLRACENAGDNQAWSPGVAEHEVEVQENSTMYINEVGLLFPFEDNASAGNDGTYIVDQLGSGALAGEQLIFRQQIRGVDNTDDETAIVKVVALVQSVTYRLLEGRIKLSKEVTRAG